MTLFCQVTVTGYIKEFYSIDSITPITNIYSIETYSSFGNLLSRQQNRIYEQNAYHLTSFIGDSIKIHVYVDSETVDSTLFYFPSQKNLVYEISNSDTTRIIKSIFSNGQLLKDSCIYGCDYYTTYTYENKREIETLKYKYGKTYYTIHEYDEKNREILFVLQLDSLNQTNYNLMKISYNDEINSKTISYLNNGEEPYQIATYYYDHKGIPIRMESYCYQNGVITQKLIVMYL